MLGLFSLRRRWWMAGAVALAVLAGCAGGGDEDEDEAVATPQRLQADGSIVLTARDRQALALQTAPAAQAEMPRVALRFGVVRAPSGQDLRIVAPTAAVIAQAPTVQLGASVAAGALLVTLTPTLAAGERLTLGMHSAQLAGQIAAAERQLATRQAALERAEKLAKTQVMSTAALQQAQTAVDTTRAQLAALRRAQRVEVTGSSIALHAPASGNVVQLDGRVGQAVAAGAVVARILQMGARWIDVAVPPDDPRGDGYEVEAAGQWRVAHLLAEGEVTAANGWRYDRVQVDGSQAVGLLPGATVAVRVAHGGSTGIVLPVAALVPVGQGTIVYVETAPNRFAPRQVEVVARFGGKARLASGVKAGELVVVRGGEALRGEALRAVLTYED